MRTWIRAVVGVALTASVGLAYAPPTSAADYGKPLPGEWWFTAWDIENKVWPISQGDGVTVAVIDTGVKESLPEFSGGVVLPGAKPAPGAGGAFKDPDHGTGIAALIAAQGRGSGYLGVAPKAKILPIQIGTDDTEPSAIRYAVDHGAKVINMSIAAPGPCGSDLQNAVAYAIKHDVVIVAGAGNSAVQGGNPTEHPANCAGVLAVGAVDAQLRAWPDSQRQSYVAVSAPGVDVPNLTRSGKLRGGDGTSDASALTAGAVALVRAKSPDMSAREVVQRIIASCRAATGPRDAVGAGAVRPIHALNDDVPSSAPNPVFAAYDKWAAANPQAGASAGPSNTSATDNSGSGVPMQTVLFGVGGAIVLVLVIGGAAIALRRK